MAEFEELELPHRAGLGSDEQTITGYGHKYRVCQWINVVVRAGQRNNAAFIVGAEAVDNGLAPDKIAHGLYLGMPQYTIGATYHIAGGGAEELTRVNSLIVCTNGGGRQRSSRLLSWIPGLRPDPTM